MSTHSSVEKSSPTTKVDTEVVSEERPTSESSDVPSGGSISSVPSQSSELNDASATTAAVVSTSARGDSGNDGDKPTTDMKDCQDASGSSSEVYSGVSGRAGANPPVAGSSTSTATEEMPTDKSSVAKSSQVNGKDTASSLPSVRGSEDQSGGGTEVDNSAGSERGESTTVSCRVCHLILSPTSTQI